MGDPPSQLVVLNYGQNYQYAVYLNAEPIYSGSGLSCVSWGNYPLVVGSNTVRFTALALSGYTKVRGDINAVGSDRLMVVGIKEPLIGANKIEKIYHFDITNAFAAGFRFEKFTNLSNLTNQLTDASLKFSKAFAQRNSVSMEDLLGLDRGTIKEKDPKWTLDSVKNLQVVVVTEASDLNFLIGEFLAVVRPSWDFFRKHPDDGLVSLGGSPTDFKLSEQCLVYCQINGRLCLFLSDTNPVPIRLTPTSSRRTNLEGF